MMAKTMTDMINDYIDLDEASFHKTFPLVLSAVVVHSVVPVVSRINPEHIPPQHEVITWRVFYRINDMFDGNLFKKKIYDVAIEYEGRVHDA